MNFTIWNQQTYQEYLTYLQSFSDHEYKVFSEKLYTTKYEVLGVRIPTLRKIAKQIAKTNSLDFLTLCGSQTFEEVLIEGLVIAHSKEEAVFDMYFKAYVMKIDNWALCDTFCNSLKIINKNPNKYFKIATKLTKDKAEFVCRVGLVILLNFFVKEAYLEDIFAILDSIKSDKYYINMAEAWLLCEVYIYYPQETATYLKKNQLNKFTHNKAISKIRESYRVSKEKKDYVNTLKRK